ncbi:MAG: PAS domain-containing sensor histidine kinase [Ignavibacteria bacterium]|nr:PAS domain-containing sensor histidine kinase [Ignavibacteria bacterium]MBT8382265.1 PAS domain-containing sensor histidine kinase [Ignavibacteria bacterium]MBT8390938.1 PAS domain-containing sensor histidine kinase [Ignavibacteria bacterium]NNJ51563.1 PAS domain-containing sensor histidine kinase [Ignavibacteriaceae bacterium]NNL19954.1 PAS domain-containing sensor histidine kinase [Ignavibacteriaceae bacterium]
MKTNKPKKLQLSLTLQFAAFFILVAGFIYFYFSQKFEDDVLEKFKFKAEVITKYIEQNPRVFWNHELDDKSQLLQLMYFNDITYLVLVNNDGKLIDAVNFDIAEYYSYTTIKNTNTISFDESLYQVVVPIYDNHFQKGKAYLGFEAGLVAVDLKKRTMLAALFSLSILLAGMVFTYFLSSISFRPFTKLITALSKEDRTVQKDLINKLLSALDKSDRSQQKKLLSKLMNNEIGLLAGKFYEILEELEMANEKIQKLNDKLNGAFKEKVYEVGYEVNQRKKTEIHLKKSEELFKIIFETAPIGMIILSEDGIAIKSNKAFCDTIGYEWFEIANANIKYIFNGNKSGDVKSTFQLIRENGSLDTECNLVRKDGIHISALLKSTKIVDDKGDLKNILIQVLDISEFKKAQNELEFALDKATESERLKSAFLAQMSHEIRTPLNVILPSIPILAEELGNKDEEMLSVLSSVANASKRLQNTIDMILSLSAVQSGSYKAKFENFNLAEDLKNLASEFIPITKEKGLQFFFINKTVTPVISADRYTINQIFQNLVGNAVKYTHNGQITVSIEDYQKNGVIVKIEDSGIGISTKYLKNLFSPFSQEDTGRTRKYEGNGLGLALVKEYVKINRGEISVESEKNVGSVFSVHFEKSVLSSNPLEDKILLKEVKTQLN